MMGYEASCYCDGGEKGCKHPTSLNFNRKLMEIFSSLILIFDFSLNFQNCKKQSRRESEARSSSATVTKLRNTSRTSSTIASNDNDGSTRQQRRKQRTKLHQRHRRSHQQWLQHQRNLRHSALERSQREYDEKEKS